MSTQFLVRHYQPGQSSVCQETLAFENEAQLRQTLHQQGKTVLSIKAVSHARPTWRHRTQAANFPVFCKEVSTLIAAGMTVVEAVDTLCARERLQGKSETIALQLITHLQQGKSLSGALSELQGAPAVLVAAVRAGERTSNLAEALQDYLKFDTQVQRLRSKVISAAIYPALVTSLGVTISLFLLIVVMPNFSSMYESLRGSATGSASVTIVVSQFVNNYKSAVTLGLLGLAAAVTYWVASGQAKHDIVAAAGTVPWLQRRLEDFQLAQIYQSLTLLLKGGYPMTQALSVAQSSALSPRLKIALGQALVHIESGGLVSQSLAQAALCDEVDRRLLAAAEKNGNFHLATAVVSNLHGERFETFLERTTRIIEPVLLLAVALMVGGIVIMMYLPVFDMATNLR